MLFSDQELQLQVLCANHVCENCVKAEYKKAKLNNQSWLEEHQNFLAEGTQNGQDCLKFIMRNTEVSEDIAIVYGN